MSSQATIQCDGPCGAVAGLYGWKTSTEARRDLEVSGWARIGRKDYCPDCAASRLL